MYVSSSLSLWDPGLHACTKDKDLVCVRQNHFVGLSTCYLLMYIGQLISQLNRVLQPVAHVSLVSQRAFCLPCVLKTYRCHK